MRKSYKAFTLVEMLIVMGIIIILMAVGIVAGRYAINRANDVAHQNSADNLYLAAQAYYADYREYPEFTSFADALASDCEGENCIVEYMDEGAFNGGTDATYYYYIGDGGGTNQSVLICVSLGGQDDENNRGFYCAGNYTVPPMAPGNVDPIGTGVELPSASATGDWTNTNKSFSDGAGETEPTP